MPYEIQVPVNAFVTKMFVADETSITYHDIQMDCADIVGIRYGATSRRVNGIEVGREYVLHLIDSSKDEIKVEFTDSLFTVNGPARIFNDLVAVTWESVGQRLMNQFVSEISQGKEVIIGGIVCNNEGVQIRKKSLFGKEKIHMIKWFHVRHDTENGALNFKSAIDSDIWTGLSLKLSYNAVILAEIFAKARTSRQVLNYLEGKEVLK